MRVLLVAWGPGGTSSRSSRWGAGSRTPGSTWPSPRRATTAPLADWPAHVEVTGRWHAVLDGALPQALAEFVAAGEPPVFVSLGSLPGDDEGRAVVLDAVRRAGCRAVESGDLHAGPGPLSRPALTAGALAERLRALVGDPALPARARALGEGIRAEDGVVRAVEAITRLVR